jgi:hypothetical protein
MTMRHTSIDLNHNATRWAIMLVAMAFLVSPVSLQAQEARDMTVTGSVDAEVEGVERQWLTISGEIDGDFMQSASWRPFELPANPMAEMLEGMPEAQREQMQAQMETMADAMGADNPAAQMFGGGASDQITLRITAFDPDSDRILREGMLTIELPPFSTENIDTLIGTTQSADISLFKNFGESTGLHVSSHSLGTEATVEFDRLEIVPDGGVAEGQFEGTLCPLSVVMQNNSDDADCILVVGRFDTELGEGEPGS